MRFLQHIYEVHITTKSPARREYFRKFSLFIEISFKGKYTIPREVKSIVKSIQIFKFFPVFQSLDVPVFIIDILVFRVSNLRVLHFK